ncbi:bifunctional diaminohydroxyphosphoribosylaminopyrimidine deaminase/5-amino-6-(5-phosphoribosylamino)uracil reductase, partial [Escherichia coli]|nr:bifunctional diaminohydroxyphosphoribosylaminopyrimidine deaminase/5-amino-6-(5-phosphoribosylamino)uracil reductase [Escherichia coli]
MMSRALKLARRGIYTTAPNPNVGCVIVRDGVIIGEGYHHRAGEPHAEVHAMRMA